MQLTQSQKAAVELSAPALQILACAGAGKTEVLARRAVRYLLEGVPADNIVAFTFTEKAAAELKDRIETRAAEADERFRLLPPSASGLFVGTIHSYCLQMLQRHGGVYEVWDVLTDEREWALLHRFARRLGIVELMTQTWPGHTVSVRKAVEVFRRSLAVVCNESISRAVLEKMAPCFAAVIRRYEDLLARMQLLSFDQMIDRACHELAPGGRLRAALEGRVREVLVDEYQDLNRAQERLLQTLVEMGARLTVVGDDDQAIYQWRGGDVSLFLRFPERYDRSVRYALAENHRSVPPLVRAASGFAKSISERLDKSITSVRPDSGPAIEILVAETPEAEAESLVGRIRSLLDAGHRPADIAVLYRSVRSSARPLVELLRHQGIPFALVGRLSLLDRPEMALLARIFVSWGGGTWTPDREQEVVTPERLRGDIAALGCADHAMAAAIVAQLEKMGRELASKGVRDLIGVYFEILRLLGLPADNANRRRQEQGLGQFSELLAHFEHVQRRAAPPEWLRAPVVSASQEAAEDMAVAAGGTVEKTHAPVSCGSRAGEVFLARLRVFLEQFASEAAEELPDQPTLDHDAINIMTVHQAKGLEFPIVFVPSLVDRRFPSSRMGEPQQWYVPEDLFDKHRYQGREDDERRLFYVAMTRARDLLVLSCFTQYRRHRAEPSRFVRYLVQTQPNADFKRIKECRPPAGSSARKEQPILEIQFSELLTFSECPYKYYLRYVCGFQPPIALEIGFGKLLHHVVAELGRRSRDCRPPDPSDVDAILCSSWYLPFASPIVQERLYEAAHRRLVNYVRNFGQELVRAVEVEKRFEVPLGLARVRGRIDLVLRANDGGSRDVELVDFKTAANRPPSPQHQNQLRMYAEVARALGMNPVRLAIHDLDADNGGRIQVEQSESEVLAFRAQLRTWVGEIRRGEFSPRRDPKVCSSCDFARICGMGRV